MKRFDFLTITLFLSASLFISADFKKEKAHINWISFEEAVEKSKLESKKVVIDVYTDWCGWCKKMEASTYSEKEIVDYINENFYAVKLNAEQKEPITFDGHEFKFVSSGRRGYHELAAALLDNQLSYPSTVFLNENFELLQPIPGYLNATTLDKILKYYGEDNHKEFTWKTFVSQYKSPFAKK
ncbi:MAG TPA: thioredoxin family protein [Cyclobacteriaceae bacterium]